MTKRNGGFSLVEVLVAIVLLGATIVPISTALVTSIRINDKTESMLQAQLDVSSAVEHLMASGVTDTFDGELVSVPVEEWPESLRENMDPSDMRNWGISPDATYEDVYLDVVMDASGAFFKVYVTDLNGLVEVETSIRKEGT